MTKKQFNPKLTEDNIVRIKKYQTDNKCKNVDEAISLLFQRLQYLEDLALEQSQKPSGMDKELGFYANPMQWIDQHPCQDRAIVKAKDGFLIYCNGKKIPIEVCLQRQKKAIDRGWKRCYPIGSKAPSPSKWRKTREEPRTKPFRDDGYVDTFDMGDGFPSR